MNKPTSDDPYRHQIEISKNYNAWQQKPILRQIYGSYYQRIADFIDHNSPGRIVEIGAGIGRFKDQIPAVIATDLFANPWIDTVCNGYALPFCNQTVSHLVLFDVFHHLETPYAFLREAARVLNQTGRLIIMEPYISWLSFLVFSLFHHEPVAWRSKISSDLSPSPSAGYYAAQGNATRLFFLDRHALWQSQWHVVHREVLAGIAYLLSGGFSKPAFYPLKCLMPLMRLDRWLSRWPRVFGARCLIVLEALHEPLATLGTGAPVGNRLGGPRKPESPTGHKPA